MEKHRKGVKLEKIEGNIYGLIEERGKNLKPSILINLTMLPGVDGPIKGFIEKWLPLSMKSLRQRD